MRRLLVTNVFPGSNDMSAWLTDPLNPQIAFATYSLAPKEQLTYETLFKLLGFNVSLQIVVKLGPTPLARVSIGPTACGNRHGVVILPHGRVYFLEGEVENEKILQGTSVAYYPAFDDVHIEGRGMGLGVDEFHLAIFNQLMTERPIGFKSANEEVTLALRGGRKVTLSDFTHESSPIGVKKGD